MPMNLKAYQKPSDAFTIAHVSDLHIGLPGAAEGVKKVRTALDHIRPDIIVVTGDIVDSPTTEIARTAKEMLKMLLEKAGQGLLLVLGNHDRFPKGNRFFHWSRPSTAVFQELGEHTLLTMKQFNNNGMRISLFGIDSSKSGRYFAQGYVQPEDLSAFDDSITRDAKGCNVCIACLHHHPLKIAEVEQSTLTEAATNLVNSAQLLRVLCRGHVEHLAAWSSSSPEAVLVRRRQHPFHPSHRREGSAVGASAFRCVDENASFNVVHVTKREDTSCVLSHGTRPRTPGSTKSTA